MWNYPLGVRVGVTAGGFLWLCRFQGGTKWGETGAFGHFPKAARREGLDWRQECPARLEDAVNSGGNVVGIVSRQHARYNLRPGEQPGRNIHPGSLSCSSMIYLRAPGPASCSRAQVREITILTIKKKKKKQTPRIKPDKAQLNFEYPAEVGFEPAAAVGGKPGFWGIWGGWGSPGRGGEGMWRRR